jgi:RNA polymerase sigma-70 factor (ECF subfamily)
LHHRAHSHTCEGVIASSTDKRSRFEAQVLPHLDAAHRFARWLAADKVEADDLVQEAILRAFRGFDGLRGGDVKAWLLAILRNCHATALQQRRRRVLVPLPSDGDARDGHSLIAAEQGPEAASIDADEGRALRRLIAALPEEQRETLVLKEIEDLSYREIAHITHVPIGTVMSRLARARAHLRTLWQEQLEGASHGLR